MSTEKEAKRLRALQSWASAMSSSGHRPPGPGDLQAIAARPEVLGDVDRAVLDPWAEAIEWILRQVKFGVHDPVTQMPAELLAPKGVQSAPVPTPAPSPRPAPVPAAEPVAEEHDALFEWWERAVEQNRPKINSLNRTKLMQVVRSGKRTPTEIAGILRGDDAKSFAAEIAGILGGPQAEAVPAARVVAEPVVETPAQATTNGSHPAPATPMAETRPAATQPAPAAEPEPITAPAAEFEPELFAAYEFGPSPEEHRQIRVLKSGAGWKYSWPEPEAGRDTVIYRIVTGDEYPPYAPEKADFVTSTTATTATDTRPFSTAVRYVQVWCNRGSDTSDALAAQPTLHAQTSVVGAVDHFEIGQDEGRVIGRWTSRPGTVAVQIYRIPIERAATGADDPQYRICGTTPNLAGFVDAGAEPGRRYLYQIRSEALVDGSTRLSSPLQQEIALPTVLVPVSDLEVISQDRDGTVTFDLRWTDPPSGRVVIYRTPTAPRAGLDASALGRAALAGAGLRDEDQLPYPPSPGEDGKAVVAGVPWPTDWNRAYFTPVTVLDDTAHVGTTAYATRTGQVVDPKIVDRVDRQTLTFGWPEGAAFVLVYIGARDQSAEAGLSGHPIEISQGEYERFGGVRFPAPLPARGCSLHAVAVAPGFERNKGKPVTIQYPGMMRMRYDVAVKRTLTGRTTYVTLTVTAENENPTCPPMVLVHNPDRVPLSYRDGTALPVVSESDPSGEPLRQFRQSRVGPAPVGSWRADVKDKKGFIRLFVELPLETLRTVALLDPPIDKLQLDGSSGWLR